LLGALCNNGDATGSIDDYSEKPGIWSFNNNLIGLPSGVQGGLFIVFSAGFAGGGRPCLKVLVAAYPEDSTSGIYYKQRWGSVFGDWIKWK